MSSLYLNNYLFALNVSFYCLVSGNIIAQAKEGYQKFQGGGGGGVSKFKLEWGVGEGGKQKKIMRIVWIFSETTQYIYTVKSSIYIFKLATCKFYHLIFSVIDANLCTITNHSNEVIKMIHTPV